MIINRNQRTFICAISSMRGVISDHQSQSADLHLRDLVDERCEHGPDALEDPGCIEERYLWGEGRCVVSTFMDQMQSDALRRTQWSGTEWH